MSAPLSPRSFRKSFLNKGKDFSKKTKQFVTSNIDLKSAKAAFAEKLSKSPSKNKSTEISESFKSILEIDAQLPKVYRSIRSEAENVQTSSAISSEIKSSIEHYVQKVGKESQSISDLLQPLIHFEDGMAVLKRKLAVPISDQVVTPLSDFLKREVPKAKESHSTWNHTRIAYDASLAKVENVKDKNSSKLREVEAECSSLRGHFENATRETSNLLSKTGKAAEIAVLKSSFDYLRAYQAFFASGLALVEDLLPKVQDLYNQQISQMEAMSTTEENNPNKEENDDDLLFDSDEEIQKPGKQQVLSFASLVASAEDFEPKEQPDEPTSESGDVGDLLMNIIAKENKRLEAQIEHQEREFNERGPDSLTPTSLSPKNMRRREIHFDRERELKHGSAFYFVLMKHMKEEMLPALSAHLETVELPPIEEQFSAGAFSDVQFGMGEIGIEKILVPLESISISFTANSVIIVWSDISAQLKEFTWFYKKETGFPRIKDSGKASAGISKGIICCTLDVGTSSGLDLNVVSTAVKISHLDVKIGGTGASVLYNIVLSAFSKSMKRKVQEELENIIREQFASNLSEITEDFAAAK